MPNSVSLPLSLVLLLCCVVIARSQESPTPTPEPTAKPRSVRITFLPPPLDGTVSLGIYDPNGKLVRILHREAEIDEFNVGADALWTTWDGKDDRGEDLPAGKYRAHGFVVGDLNAEGVGFFFNDWITTNESPRVSRIRSLAIRDGKLLLGVDLVPRATASVLYDITNKSVTINDGAPPESTASPTPSATDAGDVDLVMTAAGRNGTRWVIERTPRGANTAELKQLSESGELMRRLSSPADQPQPVAVAPSMTEDRIFLLEESSTVQRLRGLSLIGAKVEEGQKPVSDWKVDFEKSIIVHQDFSIAGNKPVASSASATNSPLNVKIKLQANPLLNDERITVEIAAGFDATGTFLRTNDGLPLFSVSETPGVIRSLLSSRGSGSLDFFQDDGAVVEQFRLTGVDQMMSFDCGSFELK